MNLTKLSIVELEQLRTDVGQEIENRKKQEKINALNEIRSFAEAKGYSLEELLGSTTHKLHKSSTRKSVPVKYRHPANMNLAWSGRGRTPKWVSEWVSSGNSIDKLRAS